MAKLGSCSGGSDGGSSVNDAICLSVIVENETDLIPIWANNTTFKMNGTILVENKGDVDGDPWTVELFLDGNTTTADLEVAPGESTAITVSNLKDISVRGLTGGTSTDPTPVNVSSSLNYKF